MRNKQLYKSNTTNNEYLQESISLFLKEVYDIMKECYGPYGSHILIGNNFRPEATKDGKTILSKIKTDGSISSAVHGSIMSVANKQVEEVGDGSTTTILLLCRLYEKLTDLIEEKNLSASVLNKTIKEVVSDILNELNYHSQKIVNNDSKIDFDMLYKAVHTSVDGDTMLANKIVDMFKELNAIEPLVIVENSPTSEHRYELVKGVETSGSIIRPDVFFNGLSRMEYNDPKIVVVNGRLDIKLEEYINYAQAEIRSDSDTIFLATGISEDTLSGIVTINRTNPGIFGRVPVFQIHSSSLNEEFLDLCASIGAKPVDSESFKRVTGTQALTNLINTSAGHCSKALLTEFVARFSDPVTDEKAVESRITEINEKIEDLKNDPTSHNERLVDLENRKAFLSRHYAKFYVGGYSPQRKAINYELANDGIPQAISCMKHGIVQGCNVVVPIIIDKILTSDYNGLKRDIILAIKDSYNELKVQLVANKLGIDKAKEFIQNTDQDKSFNIRPDDNVEVINSADTDRAILQNATDMAALLATSRAFISNEIEFDVVNKGYQE